MPTLRPWRVHGLRKSATATAAAAGSAVALSLALSLTLAGPCAAQHLGVIGPVHAIAEPDLLRWLRARLQQGMDDGSLQRLQQASQDRVRRQIESPPAVPGVSRATRPRSFHFDPTLEIAHPITDAEGRSIVAAGTRVNPLDVVALSRPLLFFDARDPEQVARARREHLERSGQVRLILTGGSYLELMRRWRHTVYFDQLGALTTRLGIRQVPALVTQDGRRLRIDELP